jgi:hypothetical protein
MWMTLYGALAWASPDDVVRNGDGVEVLAQAMPQEVPATTAPDMPAVEPMPPAAAPPPGPPEAVSVKMISARWSTLAVRTRAQPTVPRNLDTTKHRRACTVEVAVDVKGKPAKVEPGRCDPDIEDATVAAAWQWRFAPARVKGRPVPSETELTAIVQVR